MARNAPGGYCFHVINRSSAGSIFDTPTDYRYFIHAVQRAQERLVIELFAACLMPNHFHFILRPAATGDLGRWMQRLMTTHVRWHHGRCATRGPVWQGRFKAFPIEQDRHLITVMRYVERNALRANLVNRAENWIWGSLCWRATGGFRGLLSPSPVPLPSRWIEYVNAAQTDEELAAVRLCVHRGRPFGSEGWTSRAARDLGLGHAIARIGRPRKLREFDSKR